MPAPLYSHCMEKMRALIANELQVYREVIADALKRLRPLLEV